MAGLLPLSAVSLSGGRPTIKPRVTRRVSLSRHFSKAPYRVLGPSSDKSEKPLHDSVSSSCWQLDKLTEMMSLTNIKVILAFVKIFFRPFFMNKLK
jgi:hypothetical protein